MNKQIDLCIIDDHDLFRKGLIQLISLNDKFNIIYDASNCQDLLDQIKENKIKPDVILLDIKMPGMNGIECLEILKKQTQDIKVIMISMYDDRPIINKALTKGASGYLLKNSEPDELYRAIVAVYESDYYLSPSMSKYLIESIQKENQKESAFSATNLVSTELEILGYICQGFTNAEISSKVFKSKRTVEGYRQKLISKTGVKNSAALVAWAFRKGLVQ